MKTKATPALLQNEQRDEKSAPTESPDRAKPRRKEHEELRAEAADQVEETLEAVPAVGLAEDVAHQEVAASLQAKNPPVVGRRDARRCWANCFALVDASPIGW